jgi:hypothetical protein
VSKAAARWRRAKGLALWRRFWRDGAVALVLEVEGPQRLVAVTVMLDGDMVLSVPTQYGRAEDVAAVALLLRLLQDRMAALGAVAFGPVPAGMQRWLGGAAALHGVAVPAWHAGVAWQWLGEATAALGGGAMPALPPGVLAWPVLALGAPPVLLLVGRRLRDRAVRRLFNG